MKPHQLLTRKQAATLRCIPAMPTSFSANGLTSKAPIDQEQQKRIIDFLINGGVDAILVCGTTGEAATMTHEEQLGFISWTVDYVSSRVPVIAGCSSNNTEEALWLTNRAIATGANGVLLVSPYYNKPGPPGQLAHFSLLAETGAPIILYSVSSRTGGKPIPIDVIVELAKKFPNVIGHKEAEGDQQRFADLRKRCPKDFVIWSGDDGETAEAMKAKNCDGVISVAANVIPQRIKRLTEAISILTQPQAEMADDHWAIETARVESEVEALFEALFMPGEPNPQAVKTALAMMGVIKKACFRLPLVPMQANNRRKLRRVLQSLDLLPER